MAVVSSIGQSGRDCLSGRARPDGDAASPADPRPVARNHQARRHDRRNHGAIQERLPEFPVDLPRGRIDRHDAMGGGGEDQLGAAAFGLVDAGRRVTGQERLGFRLPTGLAGLPIDGDHEAPARRIGPIRLAARAPLHVLLVIGQHHQILVQDRRGAAALKRNQGAPGRGARVPGPRRSSASSMTASGVLQVMTTPSASTAGVAVA